MRFGPTSLAEGVQTTAAGAATSAMTAMANVKRIALAADLEAIAGCG